MTDINTLWTLLEVYGIATDEEQVLYGDDSVRNEIHERDAVDE
jgi:hypothetical protein